MTAKPDTALIFGAGGIGRGFIGQLFRDSGLAVTFADVDPVLVEAINRAGSYRLQTVLHDDIRDYTIGPVRALHGIDDAGAVATALAEARLAATAVGGGALRHLVPVVVDGLQQRARRPAAEPLNILLCENLKGAAASFKTMVAAAMPAALHDWLESHVGFVDTVIGRMVPVPTEAMRADDPGFIRTEPYRELPVDGRGVRGSLPPIDGLRVEPDFAPFTARKLYLHNCGHAVLAYIGTLYGHSGGPEALADSRVRAALEGALRESRAGIAARFGTPPDALEAFTADLIDRFANRALGDTLARLGRDPLRKLAAEDRLVGAARLAERVTPPVYLADAIAAALRFAPPDDPAAAELQARLARDGMARTLPAVSGIAPDEPLGHLIAAAYQRQGGT